MNEWALLAFDAHGWTLPTLWNLEVPLCALLYEIFEDQYLLLEELAVL